MTKGWRKVLTGAGLLVAAPVVATFAAEVAGVAIAVSVATTVGTALVAKGTDEVCKE